MRGGDQICKCPYLCRSFGEAKQAGRDGPSAKKKRKSRGAAVVGPGSGLKSRGGARSSVESSSRGSRAEAGRQAKERYASCRELRAETFKDTAPLFRQDSGLNSKRELGEAAAGAAERGGGAAREDPGGGLSHSPGPVGGSTPPPLAFPKGPDPTLRTRPRT